MQLGADQVETEYKRKRKQMTKALVVLMMTAAALAAQATASSGAAAPQAAKKPATAKKATMAPQPLTIPKDAVANPDGTYYWKDKQGKTWVFVKTPFGVMKNELAPVSASSAPAPVVTAFDEGDKVRFERPSPFGPIKYEKNKTELTDEERSILNNQTASASSSPNAKPE
jgi:hypothetical protein